MASDFRGFVEGAGPAPQALPLFHNTRAGEFRSILASSRIRPSPPGEPFPGEHLIYAFYGRPVRRHDHDRDKFRLIHLPISIVLDSGALGPIHRVFPFDTGAAHRGLFDEHVVEPLSWKEFELTPSLDSARRVVSAFFGNNDDYFDGMPLASIKLPTMAFDTHAYFELVRDSTCSADDRRYTCEFQFVAKDGLELTKDNVIAVILPNIFLEDQQVRETILNTWNAIPLVYETVRGRTGEHYMKVVDCARSLLKELALI